MWSRRWIVLALLASGCGLSEYDSRMQDAQQRLTRFEDESRYLTDALKMPLQVNKDGNKYPIANVFLRPPRGIGPSPDSEEADRPRGILYTYRLAKGATGPVQFVELAFAGADNKDFANDVLKLFPAPANALPRKRQARSPGFVPMEFETTDFEDAADNGYFYSVNVWHGASLQVAVVYYGPKASRGGSGKAIELSLDSFGVDADANARREAFGRGSPLR